LNGLSGLFEPGGFIGTAKLELRQLTRGQDTDWPDQIVFRP